MEVDRYELPRDDLVPFRSAVTRSSRSHPGWATTKRIRDCKQTGNEGTSPDYLLQFLQVEIAGNDQEFMAPDKDCTGLCRDTTTETRPRRNHITQFSR